MAFFLRSDSYLLSSLAQFNLSIQLSRVLRSKLLWWQYDLRLPSLVSALVLVFLWDYLSIWDQKCWLSKERLEIYCSFTRIGLYSSKLVQFTSFSKVIEGQPSPIKLRISSVSIGARSISDICSASLDFILTLLSWISLVSSSLILSCISSQKLMPTPMLTCSTVFPLYPSISRLSWLRSSLNLYIFPISKSSIFLNSALHPHWQFNPSKISEIFFCWSPMSFTTLNCSSFCQGSRADGLERSLSLSVLEMPVVLLDLRVMNSFMVSLERTEEKLEWLRLSMECSIDQQIITSAIKFISSKGSQQDMPSMYNFFGF